MGSLVRMPRPLEAPRVELARVKALALDFVKEEEGHFTSTAPDLCFYRSKKPTVFKKSVTFGVTLGLVLEGTKTVRIAGHEFSVSSPDLFVITWETDMVDIALSGSEERPYFGVSLCFGPDRVARALVALAEAGGTTTGDSAPGFVLPCDAAIASALERLLGSLADPLDRKLLAPLAMDEILFRLLRSDAAAAIRAGVGSAGDARRIFETMSFMRAEHAQKLSVEALARKAAMSPSHFAHRFRALTRTTPMSYLREVRLERARALLLEPGARAGEIGLSVGFESPAHFAREFKRRFNVTPSHYLRAREAR